MRLDDLFANDTIEDLLPARQQRQLREKAPPGKKAETWIKHRKPEFKKRYGKNWASRLYGKAWQLFGKD